MLNRIIKKIQRDGFLDSVISVLRYPFIMARIRSYHAMLELDDKKDKFTTIYKNNFWSSKKSKSGVGSELQYTENIRSWLLLNIPKLKIADVVDASCGDFNWMQVVLPKLDVKYIGLDIVDTLIYNNRVKYSSEKVSFHVADICKDSLPKCDLIIVRDTLFHLSFYDVDKFLRNLSNSNYKYLLTTSHYVEPNFENTDIVTGAFRKIDLFSKPFCFDNSKIVDRIPENLTKSSKKREMILIEKRFVPTHLSL